MVSWTESLVAERLEEAARTLRRLPPVTVTGYFSVWPHIMHDMDDQKDWEQPVIHRRGPPSAQEISRMEQTLTWFRFLSPDENRLLWLRADNTPWKSICRTIGCSRTTAWKRWVFALAKLAYGLNHEQSEIRQGEQKSAQGEHHGSKQNGGNRA
jgi:Domain of unknown function (DUF6362)